jgi:hypothetical protein
VGTLEPLHSASIELLRSQRLPTNLLRYDTRMRAAARTMQTSVYH